MTQVLDQDLDAEQLGLAGAGLHIQLAPQGMAITTFLSWRHQCGGGGEMLKDTTCLLWGRGALDVEGVVGLLLLPGLSSLWGQDST